MSIKIISPRQRITKTEYSLDYDSKATPGSGLGFPCDEHGKLLPLEPIAQSVLQDCIDHADAFNGPYIKKWEHQYTEPAIGICTCGKKVELYDPLDNDCVCGRCYNMSGQEVTPNYGRAECHADGWAYDENDY